MHGCSTIKYRRPPFAIKEWNIANALSRFFSSFALCCSYSLALALASHRSPPRSIADTSHSKFAVVEPVAIDEVRWTDGFWADRVDTLPQQISPLDVGADA